MVLVIDMTLPTPVTRYFDFVFADSEPAPMQAKLSQTGTLRTSTTAKRWLPFTARQLITTRHCVWQASVLMGLGVRLTVKDSYHHEQGSGSIKLFNVVPLASQVAGHELNTAALQRYLAEGPWNPWVLTPEAGVEWSPIDYDHAVATLRDGANAASITFTFAANGAITKAFTEGRYAKQGKGYRLLPWEGRFSDYRTEGAVHVPFFGEVGWYVNNRLAPVWQGQIEHITHTLL